MIKKYDKYKKTNFRLLETIPVCWNLQKIKFIASIYNGDSLNDDFKIQFESYNQDEIAYISSKDIDVDTSAVQYDNGLRIPKEQQKFKIAPANSTLLCIEGGSAGRKIAFINQDVFFVNKLACFNIQNPITSKYFYYSLKADVFQAQFKNSITGIIGGVSISNLKNFYLALPSIEDQSRVVNFLDHQTAIIDQLIQQKEKLIELLKEKRQAVINEAVTKGLNPKDKMKDSGIEWLGEIPERWEVVQIKRFVEDHRQGFYSSREYDDVGFKVARITDIKENNILDISDSPYFDLPEAQVKDFILKDGDFVFQRTGAHKKIGIYRGNEPAIYGSFLIRFRFNEKKINSNFLLMFFDSFIYQNQLNSKIHGGVNPNIHAENIKECIVVVPTQEEQELMVKFYMKEREKMILLIEKLNLQIDKLKEFRQSIISEAVTGKIDLRDWQPNKQKIA